MKVGVVCLAGILAIATARPAAGDPPPRDLERLRGAIAAVLAREQVPGAGIALVEGDRILWAGGVGVADLATGRPVTGDTLFRAGSITKSIVSLAFVKLAEQGRADLRARVADLAPELAIGNRWAAEQPITIAHLLEHTAGFDDMRPNETYGPLTVEAMSLGDVLAHNPGSRVARWRPGSRFSYANPGYTVAAYVLEKLTGRPYEDVVTREILAPLGMTGAALRLTPEVDARLARGYGDTEAPVPYRALYHRPGGNLMASPRDLAGLVRLGLGRGRIGDTQLISPAGMARLERSETTWLDSGDASYGLGNFGSVFERAVIRGHDGGIAGFASLYGYLPDCGVGFVVLLNSRRSNTAMRDIRHLVVEYLLAGAPPPPPPPPRAPVSDAELRRWAGTYHAAAPRHQLFAFLDRMTPGLELFVDDGRLWIQLVPAIASLKLELVPLGDDRFRLPGATGSHIAFRLDRDGRRIFVIDNVYFAEEPRALAWALFVVPLASLVILATGIALLPIAVRRRTRRSPRYGWQFTAGFCVVAMPHLVDASFGAGGLGVFSIYTLGICLLTLVFAIASIGSAVHAIQWLRPPGRIVGKLYRLGFGLAACWMTAYLAAYGIIGIRLWSY
jgi:CubicO group peptidase (beta-lactamase class C family)